MEFLGYMVYAYKLLGICLILYKTDKQFYNMIASFYISSGISSSQWLSKAEAVNFGANQFINIFLMVYEVTFITKESLPSLRDKVYLTVSSRSSLVLALTFRCKSFLISVYAFREVHSFTFFHRNIQYFSIFF